MQKYFAPLFLVTSMSHDGVKVNIASNKFLSLLTVNWTKRLNKIQKIIKILDFIKYLAHLLIVKNTCDTMIIKSKARSSVDKKNMSN
jgi:hypothetical protein